MDQISELIQSNVELAPWIIFGLLLLAGFNVPVSEDLMLFLSGWLASKNPEMIVPLFAGVYAGAYISDLMCYWLGRLLGPKLWQIKFFANMVSQDKVDRISNFYSKYGMLTLILGRFIPFGVRNGLFLTAGLGKMNFGKFAFSDWIACTISCSTFFAVYYYFGETAIEYVKAGNKILFGVVIMGIVIYFAVKKLRQKSVS
jgi:membrane-associated protein